VGAGPGPKADLSVAVYSKAEWAYERNADYAGDFEGRYVALGTVNSGTHGRLAEIGLDEIFGDDSESVRYVREMSAYVQTALGDGRAVPLHRSH